MRITKYLIITLTLLFPFFLNAQIKSVEKVTITVSEVDVIKNFYINVLEAKEISTSENKLAANNIYNINDLNTVLKTVLLQIGNEFLELQSFKSKNLKAKPILADSKSNDLWFQHIAIVVPNMQKAYEKIKNSKAVFVSSSPQTLPNYLPAAAGISAFYFRDPDGHNLEIIHFPKGKGNPKWQTDTLSTFVGIDHTAIGISDTDKENSFYQKILGMKVGGHSENYGSEQEHLNQVFGAHLWITGMQAPKGFGVEYLQYLAPPGGRKFPDDTHVYDLWHWHTAVKVDSIETVYQNCIKNNFVIISKGLIKIIDKNLNYTQAFMVRDSDGHAVLVTN